MARNECDGEPYFCLTCRGQFTLPAGTCLIKDQFVACVPESKKAAMQRRARWLLDREFNPSPERAQWGRP